MGGRFALCVSAVCLDAWLLLAQQSSRYAGTFEGVVRTVVNRSFTLELDDNRMLIVDPAEGLESVHPGERVRVAAGPFDGHGMAASWMVAISGALSPAPAAKAAASEQGSDSVEPLVKQSRETAAATIQSLPNFLCTQVMKRYRSQPGEGLWRLQDKISAEVLFNGRVGEQYSHIQVNGRPSAKSWLEVGGNVSTGEFGTLLRNLVASPAPALHFEKTVRLQGKEARKYSYRIEHEESDWKILSDYQYIRPEYRGEVWIDTDSSRILKIERKAEGIPRGFPVSSLETVVNYGAVHLGTPEIYLLPTRAESEACFRGNAGCVRMTIDFTGYRKFTGESKITF